MNPIYTREELLDLAIRCAPTSAIARRIRVNGATIFGGVTSPEGFPGWIVDAGHDRFIGIWWNDAHQKYQVSYPTQIPPGSFILKGGRL